MELSIISKKIRYLIIGLLILEIGYAQSPNWSVDSNNYEYTMTFIAFLNINGTTLSSTNDKVAAFSNNEVRGVSNLVYVQDTDRYYAYLTVFSNNSNETITFKVYDSVNNQVVDISTTINFQINGHYGNLFQSFSIASPELNDQSEILSLDLEEDNVNSVAYNNTEITIFVENGLDLTNLNLSFLLSDGADMFYENNPVESANNSFDMTSPIQVLVRSEDESQLKQYTIDVSYSNSNANFNYFKKDAVCYRGGSIKIESNNEGQQIELIKEGTMVNVQSIITGQAVFLNLEVGMYIVRISGVDKPINIALKE